jgi:hypothetical protein
MRVHGRRDVYPDRRRHGHQLSRSKPELVLDGEGWAPTWSLAAFGGRTRA